MRVIFYHGLESTPNGSKPHALREVFPDLEVPDFTGMSYSERYAKAKADLIAGEPALLIGSSLGGLLAVELADNYPDKVKGYLLLAPALHMLTNYVSNIPTVAMMVLGRNDEIDGLNTAATTFANKNDLNCLVVEDGHRLSNSVPLMLSMAKACHKAAEKSVS